MKLFRKYANFIVFSLFAIWVFWWIGHNPAPDGYQNEYLHVGNAFDLWGYVSAGDVYNVRLAAYTGYWPFGLYVLPWPLMAIMGMTRAALILSNLIHLFVLLIGATLLARRFGRPLLFGLICLCPAVFGGLTRFEPNLANVSWMALGLGCLFSSRGFADRRMSLLWGASLGVGLMMDRLTLVFFLIPPALPYLKGMSAEARKNALFAGLTALLLTGAYYREFFKYHSEEIFSQAASGEIDSAGVVDASGGPLYYFLAIIDSQAGPFIGTLMLAGLCFAIYRFVRRPEKQELALLLACLPGLLFFSLLGKKQLYYTLPALVPLAVWATGFGRYSFAGAALGFAGWLSLGCGVGTIGRPWLPLEWTAPRHVLAKPPSYMEWPFSELTVSLDDSGGEILVFSESDIYYEGFVVLSLRERFPNRKIRSIVLDPQGANELWSQSEHFVWIRTELNPWPTEGAIQAELLADHRDLIQVPPIAGTISGLQDEFRHMKTISVSEESIILFERVP